MDAGGKGSGVNSEAFDCTWLKWFVLLATLRFYAAPLTDTTGSRVTSTSPYWLENVTEPP